MTRLVVCARAIAEGREQRNFAFAIEGERIVAAGDAAEIGARYASAQRIEYGEDAVVIPGMVNGHSHAYQILMRGWADDLSFERWRSDALYRVVPRLTPEQIHATFLRAFNEMLGAGITTVVEFFYLNGAGNAHAEAAIAAARESGIRLVFARTWMDAEYAPAAFRESIERARERTLALMNAHPGVDVCVAPHSLHAASPEMLRAAAAFARERDCMMHVHVAEARYEGAQTVERFGMTPIALLKHLDALNERTVGIHAIWISEEEQRMIADAGARVVHNPMTNQYLGDGICDVTGLRALGVPVSLGTDADVRPSIFEEMRAASHLQKIARLDGAALGAEEAFAIGTRIGAEALRVETGDLHEGLFADYVVLDASAIDPWAPLVNAVVYRGERDWVREVYVGGVRAGLAANPPIDEALVASLRLE